MLSAKSVTAVSSVTAETGSHDELMARGGRYQTMFELQARRFEATMDEEGAVFDVL